MKKSEQLKKAALFTVADINNPGKQMPGNHYFFTEFQLQEYASAIAREQREADIKITTDNGGHYSEFAIRDTPLVTDKP